MHRQEAMHRQNTHLLGKQSQRSRGGGARVAWRAAASFRSMADVSASSSAAPVCTRGVPVSET